MSELLSDEDIRAAEGFADEIANRYIAQAHLTDLHPVSADIYLVRVTHDGRKDVKAIKFGVRAGCDPLAPPPAIGATWHVDAVLVLDNVGIASLPTILDVDLDWEGHLVFHYAKEFAATLRQAIQGLVLKPVANQGVAAA